MKKQIKLVEKTNKVGSTKAPGLYPFCVCSHEKDTTHFTPFKWLFVDGKKGMSFGEVVI